MTFEFLIDGYNLLHFAGLARARYRPGELERARDRLLTRLKNSLTEEELTRTTVIFDARDVPASNDRDVQRPYGMTVLFSPAGQQADDVIEELISCHPSPRQLIVVSSDLRLRRAARASRAGWIDSDSFLDELDNRPKSSGHPDREDKPTGPAPQKKSTPVSDVELESWLAEFEDVDVDQIRREVRDEQRAKQTESTQPAKPADPLPGSSTPTPSESNSAPPADESRREAEGDPPLPSSEPAMPVDSDELSFWEARIAEMFEEEQQHRKRDDHGDRPQK